MSDEHGRHLRGTVPCALKRSTRGVRTAVMAWIWKTRTGKKGLTLVAAAGALLACERSDEPSEEVGVRSSQVVQQPEPAKPPQVKPGKNQPADEHQPNDDKSPYDVPARSQAEIDAGLQSACERGQARSQPLLIEFSAPWCGDCRRLAEMKKEPVLARSIEEIPYFAVNIGRFDRHEGILEDFDIRAIANWQIVETTNCDQPAGTWKRIEARTLEPKTGQEKVTAQDLATWLDEHF